ncbi:MAG: hypothetical protein H0W42_06905 [Gemmatimonadaceae bacterium]|nr:hypothetical protein [Gemmatimonadaceae bacterium]
MSARFPLLLTLIVAAQATLGCAVPPPEQSNTPASVRDTLVGTVAEVGSLPATWISLRPSDGSRSITLLGAAAAALSMLTGAEVWVEGSRSTQGLEVSRFVVRGINGQPVDDGTVATKGAEWGIQLTGGGWRSVSLPSPELTALVGQRVWISRPPPDRTASFGVIRAN